MDVSRDQTSTLACFGMTMVILAAGFSGGCRSTRSSLAGLPGMGWVAPGSDVNLSSWDESDSAGLPSPSETATPQIAGPTSSGSTKRKSYSMDPQPSGAEDAIATNSGAKFSPSQDRSWAGSTNRNMGSSSDLAADAEQPNYPDTGFPAPFETSADDATGGLASRAPYQSERNASERTDDFGPVGAKPDRGFYGAPEDAADRFDDLQGYAKDGMNNAGDFASNAASDAEQSLQESQAQANRWADDYAAVASESYDDATERAEDLLGQAAESIPVSEDFVDRANDVAGDLGGRFDDAQTAAGSRLQDLTQGAEDLAGRAEDRLDDGYQNAYDRVSDAAEPMRNAYDQVSQRSQQLVEQGKQAINGIGQAVTEKPRELARGALDSVSSAANDLVNSDLANRASQLIPGRQDSRGIGDPTSDFPATDYPTNDFESGRADLDAALPFNGDTSGPPSDRSYTPWRPGSTKPMDTTSAGGEASGVVPAAYPGERVSDRRLVPDYR